jgi:uncharacterized protein with beta-barrel porin domain
VAKTTEVHGADAARIGAAALALVGALWLAPEAKAQCVQSASDVQCSGTEPDGFAALISGITLTVLQDAVVENSGSDSSISLESSSEIRVEPQGGVTATGDFIQAIQGVSGNTLTNQGDIIVSGNQTTGVFLGSGGNAINEATGRVLASSGLVGNTAIGIAAGAGGSVTNAGLIQASGTASVGVRALSNAEVTNTGVIRASGPSGKGVLLGDGSSLDNSGSVTASGLDGIAIRLDGNAQLANTGVLRGGDGDGAGILVQTEAGTSFTNAVDGNVSADSGVAFQGAGGSNSIRNSGDLAGDVLLGGGNDLFRWGTESTVGGALEAGDGVDDLILFQTDATTPSQDLFDLGRGTGFETLTVGEPGDNTRWTLTGSGSYPAGIFVVDGTAQLSEGMTVADPVTLQGGTARLGDNVNFQSGITVNGGRAIFESGNTTTADLTVTSAGTATAESTSALTGDLAFENGASYEVSFDANTHSRLDVTGTIRIEADTNLSLIRQDSTPQSRSIRVLTATEIIAGEFDSISGGSAFQQVSDPLYGSSSGLFFLDLTVQATFRAPARSPNQEQVGQHLDSASQLQPSADFAAFLASLQTLTGAAAGSQALEALHPEFYDAHTSAALATGSRYARMLARRPLRCEQLVSRRHPNRPSVAPCSESGWTPWFNGFGLATTRKGDDDFVDWSYGGGGMAFGVDRDLGESLLLSAMLGTSRMALDFDGTGDGSVTTLDLGFGGSWRRDGIHLRGVIEYGHGWNETRRHIEVPDFQRLALSDHGSNRVTALLEAGHTFELTPFEIEPLLAVEYAFLHEESISESNAGVVGLDIDSRSNAWVAIQPGFRAGMTLVKRSYAGTWLEWADGVWRSEITGSWKQFFGDYNRSLSAKLTGAPDDTPQFRTRAQDAQWGADLGARVSFQPHGSRTSIEVGYEAFVGDGSLSHTAMLRVRMPL